MENFGMIATWEMAETGLRAGAKLLAQAGTAGDAVEQAIHYVENEPSYQSVGFGGLPNADGVVECDAAFMNGDTFQIGGVAGIQKVKNAISVARALSHEKFNSFLVGAGATNYALSAGFAPVEMLTPAAKAAYDKRLAEMAQENLSPYDGHDTVGMVALDVKHSMAAGTSTSGLFMKKPGRVGDSPLSGSGFYVDSAVGGACATGLGEDLMKGCLAYEIVRLMKSGATPQVACDTAVYTFVAELKARYGKAGACSLIAMDKTGAWGVATNVAFTFVVATATAAPQVYLANPGPNQTTRIEKRA